jgi:RNA-directed DNA polymerase
VALLTTHNWRLPTGSPCSPVLSNIVFFNTDLKLKAFCEEQGLTYTRYADDLTFSSDSIIDSNTIERIIVVLESAGYAINRRKFRLQSRQGAQYVTGIKVNEKLNVDRGYIRNLRAILHNWKLHGTENAAERYYTNRKVPRSNGLLQHAFVHSIAGHISFLKSIKKNEPVVLNLEAQFTKLSDWFYFHEQHRV